MFLDQKCKFLVLLISPQFRFLFMAKVITILTYLTDKLDLLFMVFSLFILNLSFIITSD